MIGRRGDCTPRASLYLSPEMQLTTEEHAQLIATTAKHLHDLQASREFQAAVRARQARVATELFVAYPGRTDGTSVLLRAAADALNEFVFAHKDGDSPQQ